LRGKKRRLDEDIVFTDEILLDFDNNHPGKMLDVERIGYVARRLRLEFTDIKAYRTANGFHVYMKLTFNSLVEIPSSWTRSRMACHTAFQFSC